MRPDWFFFFKVLFFYLFFFWVDVPPGMKSGLERCEMRSLVVRNCVASPSWPKSAGPIDGSIPFPIPERKKQKKKTNQIKTQRLETRCKATEFRLVAIIVLFTLLLLSTHLRNMMTINSDHQYISSSRSRFLEFFLVKEGYHWLSLPLDRVRLKIT